MIVGDRRLDLLQKRRGFPFLDQLGDPWARPHDLQRRHSPVLVGALYQLHRDDPFEHQRKLSSDLFLLVGREAIKDAVDSLGGIIRVQGREHQMTGLGSRDNGPDGLRITHLSNHDHVGVLTHGVAQGLPEADRVGTHFALGDRSNVVSEEKFDGVLYGDHVGGSARSDSVDQSGQCR